MIKKVLVSQGTMQDPYVATGNLMGSVLDLVLGATTSIVANRPPTCALEPPAITNVLLIMIDPAPYLAAFRFDSNFQEPSSFKE